MTTSIAMVTIDCPDPRKLATFWTQALGAEIQQDFEGGFLIIGPTTAGVALGLQRVAETKSGKNRVHLDLHVEDRAAEVRRLVDLGATVVDEHGFPGFAWTVLTDPEGNEFCVGAEE